MNYYSRKLMAMLISFAILVTFTPLLGPVFADDDSGALTENGEARATGALVEGKVDSFKPDVETAAPDVLFDGFLLEKSAASSAKKTAGSKFKGANKAIYNYLNAEIAKVAEGKRASTDFFIDAEEVLGANNHWCAADLGLKRLSNKDGTLTNNAMHYLQDISFVVDALLADNPYAMYWYDKTSWLSSHPFDYYLQIDSDGVEWVYLTGSAFCSIPVAAGYSKTGETGTYETDTAIGQSTTAVVAKAQSIVDKYSGSEDRARLRSYANEICRLVSYNSTAAGTNTEERDPWQLIWVFDDDPKTNVVCEGYAKAFKFLCDLTDFKTDIDCITVSGDLDGYGHMWNIVTLADGYNYLVDMTNSDGGSEMKDELLFLCSKPVLDEYPAYAFKTAGSTFEYIYSYETMKTFYRNELMIPGDGTGHTPIEDPIDDPDEVETMEFEFANLMFYEGFGGEYEYEEDYDENGWPVRDPDSKYYRYNVYTNHAYLTNGNKITINGKTYILDNSGDFVSADGEVLPGFIEVWDDQSAENQWSIDNPGHVKVTYEGASCDVEVPLKKSPVKEFRIEFAEEQVLYQDEDDYNAADYVYNSKTEKHEEIKWKCFFYAESRVRNCFDGDVLIVDGVRYKCHIDGSNNTGTFTSASGKVLPEDVVEMVSDQSGANPWGPGIHEVTNIYYLNGIAAAEYKSTVRVVANPVASIRFEPSPEFRVVKEGENYFFDYSPYDRFIVNYNDGRGTVVYTAAYYPLEDDGYELHFRDSNGKTPKEGELWFHELYNLIDDDWQEGEHTFSVMYFGKTAEFNAIMTYDSEDIIPVRTDLPAVKISKVAGSKKSATVKWKKVSKKNQKKIGKIQIQFSRDKTFKTGVKTVTAKKSAVSKKIKKLKSKKKYYVRIRAYKYYRGVAHVSVWSKVKSVKAE